MSTRYIWGSWWEQNSPPMHVVMTKCPGCTSWYQGDTDANAQYVWDVPADVAANHNVDVSRIYAVGYSGGSEFLSIHGWEFQDTFAGIQFTCGGNAYRPYIPPPREDCKVRGRIVISQDDFLWDSAQDLRARLEDEGHEHEYVDAQCSGHCCDTEDDNQGAWEWFQTVTKCGAEVPGDCADLNTLPPAAGQVDLDRLTRAAPVAPTSSESRPAPPTTIDFQAARDRFDDVMDQLELADGPDETLFREAVAAYDLMLASAKQRGPGAVDELRARYPRLRARMAELRQP